MIPASIETGDGKATLTNKAYEKELRRLQAELCRMQEWIKTTGQRIVVVFEGRDAAGKGGIIKAITERVGRSMKRAYDDEATIKDRRWVPEAY